MNCNVNIEQALHNDRSGELQARVVKHSNNMCFGNKNCYIYDENFYN